jgi:hypothetical protein
MLVRLAALQPLRQPQILERCEQFTTIVLEMCPVFVDSHLLCFFMSVLMVASRQARMQLMTLV